jgi:hypothetical protein
MARPDVQFRRYIAGDAALIPSRDALAAEQDAVRDEFMTGAAVPPGLAWTMTHRGMPVACAGFAPVWEGRFIAWSLIGPIDMRQWAALAREVRARIAQLRAGGLARRIEASAPIAYAPAGVWLKALGFEFEGVARAYGPDGADYGIYAITGADHGC